MLTLARALCFIDTETTGVETADRVIEFAACTLNPDGTRKQFCQRFNPGIPIPPAATEIHGITDADVANMSSFSEWAQRIHKGLTGRDIAGYNVRFDISMVDEELRRVGLKLDLTGIHIVDAAGIFFKKEQRRLEDAVLKYCGRVHDGAHGAVADAAASADVLEGQVTMYEDLVGMGIPELAAFSKRDDVEYIDLAAKIYRDSEGYARYSIGKSKDQRIKDDPGFARWMLGKDFAGNTLDAVREELGRWGL